MNGWRGWLLWELGHLFCVPDTDHVKQKNDSLETTPSRFSLNRKQRSLLLYVISVQDTKFWVEFWKPLIPGQIVNSFGQGKCTFDCQSGNFKNSSSGCPCLNKVMHVENWETDQLQHDSYVSISYKFTLAWVFVSYAYTQITVNTFTNDLILFTGIIQCWWGYCIFNDRHKHNSRQLHP